VYIWGSIHCVLVRVDVGCGFHRSCSHICVFRHPANVPKFLKRIGRPPRTLTLFSFARSANFVLRYSKLASTVMTSPRRLRKCYPSSLQARPQGCCGRIPQAWHAKDPPVAQHISYRQKLLCALSSTTDLIPSLWRSLPNPQTGAPCS
jgi:hypothetical protein